VPSAASGFAGEGWSTGSALGEGDEEFMQRFSSELLPEHVPWPWLSGGEWEGDLVVRCGGEPRREGLAGWDEFLDLDTGALFYRHARTHEREAAARRLQKLVRQRKCFPLAPVWESACFSFDCPPEVSAHLDERAGWALLKRRSVFKRKVQDEAEFYWGEFQDTVSGDVFYTEQTSQRGWSRW
jgi:hypothetical protein